MVIDGLGALIRVVQGIRSYPDQAFWFRGQRSFSWELNASINRGYTRDDEKNLTNRFRARAAIRRISTPGYEEHAEWLSLMQHYGLPTRLMDWSRSPLVATYFALLNAVEDRAEAEESAALWVLDPFALNECEGFQRLTLPVNAISARPLVRPAFASSSEELEKVMAVMAAEADMRMFVQQGCFTVHSAQAPLNAHQNADRFLWKIEIPKELIAEVSDQLRTVSFRRGDLFPDLDNLALEMRSSYPPGWAAPIAGDE